MKKSIFKILPCILCMSVIFTSCCINKGNASSSEESLKLTKRQWIEDIDYLEKNLSKKHYNVYHSIKKEDYEMSELW